MLTACDGRMSSRRKPKGERSRERSRPKNWPPPASAWAGSADASALVTARAMRLRWFMVTVDHECRKIRLHESVAFGHTFVQSRGAAGAALARGDGLSQAARHVHELGERRRIHLPHHAA